MAYIEDLDIWKNAKQLTLSVYRDLQMGHDYGFKDQIQRAAVSVMNNIAEGSEAGSPQMYIRLLHIARGSCAEVRNMLYLSEPLGYCTEEKTRQMIDQCRYITASINKLIAYLDTKKQ
jgi:four helix bundle protein